ncbi:ubiquinol-cytochrome c oxidoreductase [Gigaspora rosea]|uniref:Cytochrome b-c1 complex subunit 8 n=1 Tax=Gigaspora rosea TaxID=44941 RepID=A0A397UE60_9GLOM|nr:ubiquinol-cytochrome c oxidoreductase [Gigaspora rosea]
MGGGPEHPWWGNLGGPVQRHIVTYSISPYKQRLFVGALSHGVFNTYRRVSSQAFYVGVPVFIGLLIYYKGSERHEYYSTKAAKKLEK